MIWNLVTLRWHNELVSSWQVLICRNYRGDVDMNIIDKFIILLREREDDGTPPPILHYDGVSFSFIKVMDLYGILVEIFISQWRHDMEMVYALLALVRGMWGIWDVIWRHWNGLSHLRSFTVYARHEAKESRRVVSHELYTPFGVIFVVSVSLSVPRGLWSICPVFSGPLHCHRDRRTIFRCQWSNPEVYE